MKKIHFTDAIDFSQLCNDLRRLTKEEIVKVGTILGLNYGRLSDLPAEKFPHEMIQWWLEKRDYVMKISGTPTLRSLIKALEENGFDGHANKVKKYLPEVGKRKPVSVWIGTSA